MSVEILKGNKDQDLLKCAEILKKGGLVIFPTETVYGIGADARNETSVERIYKAKGRPANNPSIVHLPSSDKAKVWSERWDDRAEKLAQAFWPGPLTMILPASPDIARKTLAGGRTVGLRVPGHPVARRLLEFADLPVAAPSANLSNSLSPTRIDALDDKLMARVDAILDGGECGIGIESTVIDLTDENPIILRPGMIQRREIEKVLQQQILYNSESPGRSEEEGMKSPGQFTRHYSPRKNLYIAKTREIMNQRPDMVFPILLGESFRSEDSALILPLDPSGYAQKLYYALWRADHSDCIEIWIESPPLEEPWRAIHDRLIRASGRSHLE